MMSRIENRVLHVLAGAMVGALLLIATSAAAQRAPANFIVHPAPKQVPDISFADERGRALTLGEFQGKTVLLNVWATWCGPCRREMAALDRVQERLGSERFQVVALSIDRGGATTAQRFYAEIGIRHLSLFIDATARAGSNLGLIGLPGTLLIDPQGKEIGRLVGPAEWDSTEMIAFLESQIAPTDARRMDESQPTQRKKEQVQ